MSLRHMFAGVADRYDRVNPLITWGFDECWRRVAAKECTARGVVVDLGCGTGDLLLSVAEQSSPDTQILGIDFSRPMIGVAKRKVIERKGGHRGGFLNVDFVLADAAHIPVKNESISCVGMSFSFRNLVYKNPRGILFMREVLRVIGTGGRFVSVETSQPRRRLIRAFYHLYLRKIVPRVGGMISGRRSAYLYLSASAANFPPAEEVTRLLLKTGFREAKHRQVTLGIVAIHVAKK